MSGPVGTDEAPPEQVTPATASRGPAPGTSPAPIEVSDAREAMVGAMRVRRSLPRRGRRTVGAWCFADHLGPAAVTEDAGVDIGPHPHIGLQTVTWLLSGEVLHRDSLGSEQVIRPGQLNLMTAGRGVAHSEEATGAYRGELHGVQLWVAQPESTRHGAAAFEHHPELPRLEWGSATATVLVGDLAGESGGARSPARHDTPLLGADLTVSRHQVEWPLRPEFEHAVLPLTAPVSVDGRPVGVGQLGYLGPGRERARLAAADGRSARLLLLGGEPFAEPILMWWNFVARSRDEIVEAWSGWEAADARFGSVASPLARLPAPTPPWLAGA